MYTKGDFHIHSTYSDGSLTPSQIINLAKKRDMDIISITDHNNTSGIDEAIIAAIDQHSQPVIRVTSTVKLWSGGLMSWPVPKPFQIATKVSTLESILTRNCLNKKWSNLLKFQLKGGRCFLGNLQALNSH